MVSNELDINVKMSSTSWTRALERFDQDVDLNSLTKKEVRRVVHWLGWLSCDVLDRQFIESSFRSSRLIDSFVRLFVFFFLSTCVVNTISRFSMRTTRLAWISLYVCLMNNSLSPPLLLLLFSFLLSYLLELNRKYRPIIISRRLYIYFRWYP